MREFETNTASEPDFVRGLTEADASSQRGLELLAAGDPTAAADSFRTAIAADPSHLEAHHGLVRALRDAERFQEAVSAANELVLITPLDPLAFASLSIALQKAGQIPEAESAAARARVLEWKQQLAEPATQGDAVVDSAAGEL